MTKDYLAPGFPGGSVVKNPPAKAGGSDLVLDPSPGVALGFLGETGPLLSGDGHIGIPLPTKQRN